MIAFYRNRDGLRTSFIDRMTGSDPARSTRYAVFSPTKHAWIAIGDLPPPPPLSVCYRIVPCHHRPPASSLPGGRAWRYLCTHPVRRQSSRLPRFPSSRQRPRHPPGNTTLLSLSLCIWPNIIIYKYHYNKTHLSSSPPTYFPSHSNVLDDKSAEACRGDEKGGNFTKNYEDTKGSCVARNLMKDVNITPVSRTLEYKKLKTVTPKISPHIS